MDKLINYEDLSTFKTNLLDNDNVSVNSTWNSDKINARLVGKQNKLNAGANISIVGNTISATDTVYQAGANISISGNTISAEYEIATTAEIEALFVVVPPVQPGPPSDEIWYTTSNGQVMSGYNTKVLPTVVSNTYSDGKGILKFAQPITSIGTDAFLRAYTIQTLNLPYTVNYLASNSVCHYEASWSTALLSDVTFNSDTPPTNNSAFGVLDEYNKCTIRVPADALQTYRSAWEYYSSCIVAQN